MNCTNVPDLNKHRDTLTDAQEAITAILSYADCSSIERLYLVELGERLLTLTYNLKETP